MVISDATWTRVFGRRPDIPGQPVTLTLTRGPQCTAVTDANGRATCGNVIVILNLLGGGTFTATYAGNATYQPSSAKGTIP